MGKVFISYAREDKNGAYEICKRLQELGFDPWIDGNDLAANDDITAAIDAQISKVDAVLVLWSDAAKNSVWVRGEALSGLTADKYVGALLQPVVPPVPFNTKNAPDLSDWNLLHDHKGWLSLVRGLAAMVGGEADASLAKLQQSLDRERAVVADAVQAQLPLADAEELTDTQPAEEHAYSDVDSLVAEAQSILSSSAKLDLTAAIVQAAMDQEMLRDAAFVIASERQKIAKPKGAKFAFADSIQKALDKAKDGDLIVVGEGTYVENLKVTKKVRLVGLGYLNRRPRIMAAEDAVAVEIRASARIENINIETRHTSRAVHFVSGQAVLLRCDVTRFAPNGSGSDPVVYVSQIANPIVMAANITSKGCVGVEFVTDAGGTFIGVNITASRGAAISCRGRPKFRGCAIEAVGGHAVEVKGARGYPTFDECAITGRGAAVVKVVDARPRMNDSRVKAIRQLAFDFEGDHAGRFERNIIDSDNDADSGSSQVRKDGFFGLWRSNSKAKDDVRISAARRIISMRSTRPPVFVANKTADGSDLQLPPPN